MRIAFLLLALAIACTDAPTATTLLALDDLGEGAWSTVSTGRDHTCALTNDGAAYCWGANDAGQLLRPADGPAICQFIPEVAPRPCSQTPISVLPNVRFSAISAGAVHSCALAVDRTVYCWGDNAEGQLGDVQPARGIVHVTGSLGFAAVTAGAQHSCAIRTDGALLCWGRNNRGQLGTGDKLSYAVPTRVSTNLPFASVSAGDGRTCARTTIGAVYCWGAIWLYRQNGLEYTRDQTVPERVANAPLLASLSVGSFTTCGTDATGVAYCWEANNHGQMGTGTTDGSTVPLAVASSVRFATVSVGIIQTCAIAATGAGYCWGNDTFGQLGVSPYDLGERCADATLACATHPIPVYGRQQFVSISTGFGNHSCGVTTKSNLYCWGLGALGQLGSGVPRYREVIPVLVGSP